jgi:hypothetical protein
MQDGIGETDMTTMKRLGLAVAAVAMVAALGSAATAESYFYRSGMSAPGPQLELTLTGSPLVRINGSMIVEASAKNGSGGYDMSVTGTLPSGLTRGPARVSGSPSQAGSFPVSFNVTDRRTGRTSSKAVTIVVAPLATVSGPSSIAARIGSTAVSQSFSAPGAFGTVAWTASSLPAGLSIDGASGLVSGTATSSFSSAVTISAKDGADGSTVSKQVTVSAKGAPSFAVASISGNAGTALSRTFVTSDLLGSTSFTATGLPSGLSINSNGLLSGTPSAQTSGTATIKMVDNFDGLSQESSVPYVIGAPLGPKWVITGGGPQTYATSNWQSCASYGGVGNACNQQGNTYNCHQYSAYRYEMTCQY